MQTILNFFSEERKDQLMADLSSNLYAVISQRLIPAKDGKGRVAAVEVLIGSPLVSNLVADNRTSEIYEVMERAGDEWGMQTFDQSLFELYENGSISYEEAMKNANSQNNLRLKIKLEGESSKTVELGSSMKDVQLKDDDSFTSYS